MKKKHYLKLKIFISKIIWLFFVQLISMSYFSSYINARDYFNPAFLELDNQDKDDINFSAYEKEGFQSPGVYLVDIYINNKQKDTRDIEFRMVKVNDKEILQPCLSTALLSEMGVNTELLFDSKVTNKQCIDLSSVPQVKLEFRFNEQQLLISIPQVAISAFPRGYIPESQWDNGIPAFLINYSLLGSNSYARTGVDKNDNSQYMNLRPGLNIGPWRLRNYTVWSRDSSSQNKWNTVYTYLGRNVVSLKSWLVMGDSSSPSDVFDSVPFRGVQLSSDDDMQPESLLGYAPVVRGIARTNAKVIIRQNGYEIYQTYVTPGAFEINDMYPTGSGGDLFVIIQEADGSEHNMIIPFASLPVLQREGRLKYSLTGGQYRSYDNTVAKTSFLQSTLIYGLPYGITAYTGGQIANIYDALALGIGKNFGKLGAISADVTQARSVMRDHKNYKGQSWRIRYSKNFVDTGTNFTIAGYRYSTDSYYSFQDVMNTYRTDDNYFPSEHKRDRAELVVSQHLWEGAGSLSLNLMAENYWNKELARKSISIGYNNNWRGINYSINYSYNDNSMISDVERGKNGKVYNHDQVFSFNMSLPLDRWFSNTYATYSLNSERGDGPTTHNVGVSGTALENNNLSWGVQQGYGNLSIGNNGSLNMDYRGTYAEVVAGYAYDKNNQRLNYGLHGGILAHKEGVTFGQSLGETVGLLQAKGASGVEVSGYTGVKTDWRGYTIIPYVTPYRKNQINLSTEKLADNIDFDTYAKSVIPTRGAVVRVDFNANIGQRVLMSIIRPDGKAIPFGAIVSDMAQPEHNFITGDHGKVYITGIAETGELQVKWGSLAYEQCRVKYTLSQQIENDIGIKIITAKCQW